MSQFISPLTEPIGALWGLMVLGVLWLLIRRQWRSAIWLGFPTAVLFILGSTPLAEKLVASEERQWAGAGMTADYRPRTTDTFSTVQHDPPHESGRADLPVGPDARQRAPTTVQGSNARIVTGNSHRGDVEGQGAEADNSESGNQKSEGNNGSQVSAFQHFSVSASAPYRCCRRPRRRRAGFATRFTGLCQGRWREPLLTAIQLVRSGRAKTLVLGGSWPMPGQTGCALDERGSGLGDQLGIGRRCGDESRYLH